MPHLWTKIAEYGIIIKENQFLILQLSKGADTNLSWILPGGRLDEGEKPAEGLKREIKEETGLDANVHLPCYIGMWGEGEEKRYAVFYLCTPQNLAVKLSIEHDDYKWVSFEKFQELENTKPHLKEALRKAKELLPFIQQQ